MTPKLNEVEVNYTQVCELVKQLEFKEKMDLIREITKESDYKDKFYMYTERLAKQYNIPKMSEEELDKFLHQRRKRDENGTGQEIRQNQVPKAQIKALKEEIPGITIIER